MQDIDQAGFNKLRRRHGRGDADDRLVLKKYRPLRQSENITVEVKSGQVFDETGGKPARFLKVLKLCRGKLQAFKKGEKRLQSCCHEKTSFSRQLANIKLKDRLFVHASIDIALQHGQLIEVRQKRTGQWVHFPPRMLSDITIFAPLRAISPTAFCPSPGLTFTAQTASART